MSARPPYSRGHPLRLALVELENDARNRRAGVRRCDLCRGDRRRRGPGVDDVIPTVDRSMCGRGWLSRIALARLIPTMDRGVSGLDRISFM